GLIDAGDESFREPARRLVRQGQTAGRAVRVLRRGEDAAVVEHIGGRDEEAALGAIERERGALHVEVIDRQAEDRAEEDGVALIQPQVDVVADERQVGANVEPFANRIVNTAVRPPLPQAVDRLDPLVLVVVSADAIPQGGRSAADGERVSLVISVPPDRRAARVLRLRDVDADDGIVVERIEFIVRRDAPFLVHEPLVALTDRRIPLGPTAGAALRDDLNDAVRRLGAVDRARGRPLDDLDALYVFRIEVIETRHDLLALGARRSGVRIVHDAHAVDVDERLRGQAERRDAADRDVRSGPRLPVAGREGDPRRPGIEHPGDVLRPGDLEALRHADLGHRVPDLAARLT